MRPLIPAILALACVPAFGAEPKEKPVGRTMQQRFNATTEEQQALVFDPRQGAVGGGRTIEGGKARTKGFLFGKSYSAATYDTGKFQTKKSWLDRFRFGSKSADVASKSADGKEAFTTKTAATKENGAVGKKASAFELAEGNREFSGPERKKLDRSVDPKSLADWRNSNDSVVRTATSTERYGTLKQLSVEDVREILNKNK